MILLEPDRRFRVVLDADKDKPEPPAVWACALSGRAAIDLKQRIERDAANDSIDNDELPFLVLADLVKQFDHDQVDPQHWQHSEPAERANVLLDCLTVDEAWELLTKIRNNQHMGPEEKKSAE
jgi:hypothetical protein